MFAGVIATDADTGIKRMIRLLITADRAGSAESFLRVVLPGMRFFDITFRAGMLIGGDFPVVLANIITDGTDAAVELVTGDYLAAGVALDALIFLGDFDQRMRKQSITQPATMLSITGACETAGMRTFPFRAADRANSRIAGKIAMRRMFLVAFLADAASVVRPAMLMRAGE